MAWKLSAKELEQATGGTFLSRVFEEYSGVGTDTRKDLSGQIFVALRGANFDAHNYIHEAIEKGAHALIIDWQEAADEVVLKQVSVILVDDTLKALQDLGLFWRSKNKFRVVGITGSNGKTTTKEFTRQLLEENLRVYSSPGSFNNHWGVPLTLLASPPQTQLVLSEMGMNHPGEITKLCEIAEPDLVGVTMVGSAHIGKLGTREAIAAAKEEIYHASPKAQRIYNLDNDMTKKMYENFLTIQSKQEVYTFSSSNPNADVQIRVNFSDINHLFLEGRIKDVPGTARVPVFGQQNVTGLMFASCVALYCGLDPEEIWQKLVKCRTSWGRNQLLERVDGGKVLFDAYNANPESLQVLLENLDKIEVEGRRVAILGEMLEMGDQAVAMHRELGERVARSKIDVVWFVGSHMGEFKYGLESVGFDKTSFFSETYEESLAIKLGSMLNSRDVVVIKGSRGIRLEQVLKAWYVNPE